MSAAAATRSDAAVSQRVLMLLENSPYPQDDRVRREARTLQEAGHIVTVVAPRANGQRRRETVDGVGVLRYPAARGGNGLLGYLWEYGWSMFATLALTIRMLARPGFDVVHAHNPPDLFVLIALLLKPFGKKFVFDVHDLGPELYDARFNGNGRRSVRALLVQCERLSSRVANQIIVTNESYRDVVRSRHGVGDERITTVRNGPDPGRIHPVAPDPRLREGASVLLGYVGVTGHQDGLDYLLRALSILTGELEVKGVRCYVMGDGEAMRSLRALSSSLGLEDVVSFTGWLDDVELRRHLSSIDIGVVPDPSNDYNDRSTMLKVAEYMAMGKPVVAFDLPEHRVTAADTALYARPNDERDFALRLQQLITDAALRLSMGSRARERVRDQLEWRHSAPQLLASYARLA